MHKARLYYLKNRYTILLTLVAFVLLTTLSLQVILLRQALHQSEDNEDTLKGISCILLIKPEVRTQEKINACIDANSGTKPEDQGFKFNPPETSDETEEIQNQKPVTSSNKIAIPSPISPRKPILIVEKSPQPSPTKPPIENPIKPVVQEVETRLHPITGILQCKAKADTYWKSGEICE